MKVDEVSRIAGAMLFVPTPHRDDRGFFCRTFDVEVVRAVGIDPAQFTQDSVSRSSRGVVRGLHVRRGDGEAKMVRCSYGASSTSSSTFDPSHRPTETGRALSFVATRRCRSTFRQDVRTGFRPSPIRRTSPIASTALTTLRRTCRSHSMMPSSAIPWPLPVAAMSQRDRLAPPLSAAAHLL